MADDEDRETSWGALKKRFWGIGGDQASYLQLSCAFIFVLSFVAVMAAWLFMESNRIQIPLILFGTIAIVILVLMTEKGIGLAIAVLIIGTIVAQEEFLLKVAHMFGESQTNLEDYLGTTRNHDALTETPDQIAARIAEEVSDQISQNVAATARDIVNERLSNTGLSLDASKVADDVANKIAEAIRGTTKEASRYGLSKILDKTESPDLTRQYDQLAGVVNQHRTFKDLNTRYGGIARFNTDMRSLLVQGLIACSGVDWSSCAPTSKGEYLVNKRQLTGPAQGGSDG